MDWIASGVTDQYIYFLGVDSVDLQTPETGLSGFSVSRSRNGGTLTAMTTPTVSHLGNGLYRLLLDEDMTIGAGNITESMAFYITATGMKPVYKSIVLYNADYWATATNLQTVDDNVDAILVDTGTTLDGKIDSILTDTGTTLDGKIDSILTDTGTTIPAQLDSMSGATFDTATDSLEAIRNRGDAEWTTGGGGSAPTVEEIRSEMDSNSTQLAAIVADTNELQSDDVPGLIAALNDLSSADVNAACDTALADYDAPTKAEMDSGFAALNDVSSADVNAACDTALSDYDAPTKAELDSAVSSLATSSALATVDSNVDAIKAKTDDLTFTKANELDANIQSINGAAVSGDGDGTPWDAA